MLLKRAADRVLKTRDGARRERTVHRLRRRRHRRRRRGRDGRQDAALGRDVHRREPLLRRGRRPTSSARSSRRRWAKVKVGNGFDDGVTCGPLINTKAVASSRRAGAGRGRGRRDSVSARRRAEAGRRVLLRSRPCSAASTAGAEIAREEIFGPVAPIITFTDTDDMIRQANDTEMGLTGYVYTRDLAKGLRGQRADPGRHDRPQPRRRLRSGGAVRRHEAVAASAAKAASEGIYEFCETQYIATNW